MKKILSSILIASVLLTISCVKKNTPDIVLDEMTDSTAVANYAGMFSNGPYGSVSGTAKIFSTAFGFELKLMDFRSSNGPDLRVYLSKEMQPVNYIDLGALKATGGNQVYEINGPVDFTQYRYALIHCRQYNHLFGWALLQ
jgi:hypothetical protein